MFERIQKTAELMQRAELTSLRVYVSICKKIQCGVIMLSESCQTITRPF